MNVEAPRRYRFAPAGKPGLFGLIPPAQIAVAAGGTLVAWVLMVVGVFPPAAAIPALVGAGVAFKRVDGHPLYQLIPIASRWWWRRRRGRWCRPIPLLGATDHVPVELPPAMRGLRLIELIDNDGRRRAVVHDQPVGTVSAVLAVSGDGQFSLADPLEQDRRVAMWGDAIAGFCRERTAVCRVAWQEWTAPAGSTDELGISAPAETQAECDYQALVRAVAPTLTTHEPHLVLTVRVDAVTPRRHQPRLEAACEALFDQARLFTSRLETAGLTAGPVLSPVELTHLVRTRSDPQARAALATVSRSLASLAGRAAADFGPMAVDDVWQHVQVNGALHRSFWVRGWPRVEVPAAWMDNLLAANTRTGTRTTTVVFEPIAPSVAARAAERDAVRLEASEHSRQRRGFRTRAGDHRARQDVEAREHELTAGYGDVAYAGFITVTAPSPDLLADLASDTEQSAAQTGVLLDPLDGRHGEGWVASLPLGRSVADQHHPA